MVAQTLGRLVAIVGPSGVGKDTLLAGARALRPALVVARKSRGAFALHWVAHGLSYGIPATIHADMAAGRIVLFNGSRGVLSRARMLFPDVAVIVVTADRATLQMRLAARGRESGADLDRRLERADFALPDDMEYHLVDNSGAVADGVQALVAVLDRLAEDPRG